MNLYPLAPGAPFMPPSRVIRSRSCQTATIGPSASSSSPAPLIASGLAWPTSAHLEPYSHYSLVLLFDADSFAELAQRIKLATHAEEQHAFFVAGEEGIVRSRDISNMNELVTGGYFDEARAWLGVEPLQPDEEAL